MWLVWRKYQQGFVSFANFDSMLRDTVIAVKFHKLSYVMLYRNSIRVRSKNVAGMQNRHVTLPAFGLKHQISSLKAMIQ